MSKRRQAEADDSRGLRHTGKGFLPGVPARDLSADEADEHGREALLASGCYEEVSDGGR